VEKAAKRMGKNNVRNSFSLPVIKDDGSLRVSNIFTLRGYFKI
jgi:hypothetical protein